MRRWISVVGSRRTRLGLGLAALAGLPACRGCTGIDDFALESAAATESSSTGTGEGGTGQGAGSGTGGDSGPSGGGGPPAGTGGGASTGGGCEPCYSGPPDTEGIGTCEGGLRCGGGACEGEVLPAIADDCVTAQKEDCEPGAGAACTGSVGWHGVITENSDFFLAFRRPIAAAPDGRAVAMSGYLNGTFFDGAPLTAVGNSTVVFGLDDNQNVAWRALRPAPADQSLSPLGVAAAGDTFALALQRFDGVSTFVEVEGWDWGSLTPRSTRSFRNVSGFFALGLAALDADAFVAFNHDGTADLDGDGSADGAASPVQKGFLARIDASAAVGTTVWSRDISLTADVAIQAVALASDGLWFAGMTRDALDLGCPAPVAAASAFLGRLDPTSGDCEVLLGVGSLGVEFEELEFSSALLAVSDTTVYSYFPSDDLLVARSHALDVLWSIPVAAPFAPTGLSVDGFGHPILVGSTTMDPLSVATARKLSRVDGSPVWPSELQLPATDSSQFLGVAGRADGSVLLGGSFFGSITLQGVNHPPGAGGSASAIFLRTDP